MSSGQSCGNWQKYNNPNSIQRWLITRFLHTVSDLVEQTGARTLADVGCAEGFVTEFLRRRQPGLRCVGMDTDRHALQRGQQLSGDWFALQASIYHLPYPPAPFDVVLALEVLEHLEKPQLALVELKRIASQYCLLSVPHEPFFRMANFLRGKNLSRWGNDADHVNHWDVSSFVRLMRDAHLVIWQIRLPFPWIVALAEV